MHKLKVQLRFNDIDILGHLNNTVYFSLYDLGKARYMEDAGLRRHSPEPPSSVIADVHCAYIRPIRYGDEIYVETRCTAIGEKSFVLAQQLVDSAGDVRSRCRTVMVYFDPSTGLSAPVPDDFRARIVDYEGRELPAHDTGGMNPHRP